MTLDDQDGGKSDSAITAARIVRRGAIFVGVIGVIGAIIAAVIRTTSRWATVENR
jgi:hypothetical protein